jgi:hypothetical protein
MRLSDLLLASRSEQLSGYITLTFPNQRNRNCESQKKKRAERLVEINVQTFAPIQDFFFQKKASNLSAQSHRKITTQTLSKSIPLPPALLQKLKLNRMPPTPYDISQPQHQDRNKRVPPAIAAHDLQTDSSMRHSQVSLCNHELPRRRLVLRGVDLSAQNQAGNLVRHR